MSMVQVLSVGGLFFILYRFIIRTVGIEMLGVWSIVLAATSVANVANLGFAGSVVKFTAKYNARNDNETVARVIETSAISLSVVFGVGLLVLYPLCAWMLRWVVPSEVFECALSLLPYAVISFWITQMTGVIQACLEGYQRFDIRSMLVIGGALGNLLLCLVMLPAYGFVGLAYAQVINAAVLLVVSWVLLKRMLTVLPFIPYRWDRKLFGEMFSYGANFQIITVLTIFHDPVTKALLTKFGGLAVTGYYEMASKMVMQFRSLLVSANQVLVPTIADLQESNQHTMNTIYSDSYGLLTYVSLPVYSIIIALSPTISVLWIGEYQDIFVICSSVLCIGWFVNTLSVPAYFYNMGTGDLKWNVVSHVAGCILNFVLGFILGNYYGPIGVISGWFLSALISSLIIIISYYRIHEISYGDLLPTENAKLLLGCIFGIVIVVSVTHYSHQILSAWNVLLLSGISFVAAIWFPLWTHPVRERLWGWLSRYLIVVHQE